MSVGVLTIAHAVTALLADEPGWGLATVLAGGAAAVQAISMSHRLLMDADAISDLLIVSSFAIFLLGLGWTVQRLRRIAEFQSYLWVIAACLMFVVLTVSTTTLALLTLSWRTYHAGIVLKLVCGCALFPAACFFAIRLPPMASSVRRFFDLQRINREQAERLQKSEEFLDRTGRLAGVGGWEVDLVTGEITWSDETCRIHAAVPGYRPTMEEALNVYPGKARKTISEAVQEATAGGPGFDLELPVVSFDGKKIWARAVGAAELRDGKAVRLSGAFQDVTAKVEAREALRQATERMALATESGGIGIWDWDIDGNSLICDSWMYRLHGRDPQRPPTPGELWRDHLHPEDKEHVEQALEDALKGVRDYDTEFRLIWDDGSVHHLRGAARVTRDGEGRALHMVGANWEVTESRRLIAQLAEERELLRVTLNSIGDGVITFNSGGRIDWLNPVAEWMTGWTLSEAIGLPLAVVFQTLDAEGSWPDDGHCLGWMTKGELEGSAEQTLLISRKGAEYGIECSRAPIGGADGDPLGTVLVFRDVTERRRLTAEANEATRAQLTLKDEFLSHVSHELRSPLTSIYSFTSIIADGLAGEVNPAQNEYLQIVIKNVAQLQSMIEDLLTVTQSKEGKLGIEPQRVMLQEAVVDTINTVQGSGVRKQISVSMEECGEMPEAYVDPMRLRQVLIILLDNAIKFTPVGGEVRVRIAKKDDDQVLIEVADTGCGIPVNEQAFVFEKLYQVTGPHEADTNHLGRTGLGLGLHIARDLVLRQGGSIWVTSVADQGSVFHFTLPIYREADGGSEEVSCKPRPAGLERRRKTDWPDGMREAAVA